MGNHYIPQYYLKGFSAKGKENLWAYDKINGGKICAPIKKLANENKLYSAEVEEYLANIIEGPANNVLKKIRERGKISDNDKQTLAVYMAIMYKRIPQGKQRLKEYAPRICNELLNEFNQDLDMIASEEPDKIELVEKRRNEIKIILERYAEDPPNEVWMQMIKNGSEMSPRVVGSIIDMNWTFLTFDKKPVFLTCDNPLFYFSSIGIGNPESEITFPISSHITIWATRRYNFSNNYTTTNLQVIKEINRRTVSNANRFVYSGHDEHWVSPFVAKGQWQLNRLL